MIEKLERQEFLDKLQVMAEFWRGAWQEQFFERFPLPRGRRSHFDEIAEGLDVGQVQERVIDAFELDGRKRSAADVGGRHFVAGQKRLRKKFFLKAVLRAAAGESAQQGHIARAERGFAVDRTDVQPAVEILDDGGDVFLDADVRVEVLDQNDK